MSNEMIVFVAMCLATVIMFLAKAMENIIYKVKYDKMVERTKYLKQLVKEDKVKMEIINLDTEKHRIAFTNDRKQIVIDGKVYGDKKSFMFPEDGRLYILGFKEDFVIALVGAENMILSKTEE